MEKLGYAKDDFVQRRTPVQHAYVSFMDHLAKGQGVI